MRKLFKKWGLIRNDEIFPNIMGPWMNFPPNLLKNKGLCVCVRASTLSKHGSLGGSDAESEGPLFDRLTLYVAYP